jgi:hypothetical protein
MPTTDPLPPLELEEEETLLPPRPLLGGLPGFPRSRPLPPSSPPDPPPIPGRPPPTVSPGPDSTGSSPGSTDRPPRVDSPAPPIDPRDFREAVRAGVDIAFVIAGQAVGSVSARRTGAARDANRWKPTPGERRRVADPAFRIARRHIVNSTEAMDAIDLCLMAAGVGAYVSRAGFNLAELEDLDADLLDDGRMP